MVSPQGLDLGGEFTQASMVRGGRICPIRDPFARRGIAVTSAWAGLRTCEWARGAFARRQLRGVSEDGIGDHAGCGRLLQHRGAPHSGNATS